MLTAPGLGLLGAALGWQPTVNPPERVAPNDSRVPTWSRAHGVTLRLEVQQRTGAWKTRLPIRVEP